MQLDKVSSSREGQPVCLKRVNRKRYSRQQGYSFASDLLAVEEPLQISIEWQTSGASQSEMWSMTMRTPGDDVNLVYGLLLSQNVVDSWLDIQSVRCFDEHVSHAMNHVLVTLKQGVEPRLAPSSRRFVSTSSCGVCGATSVKALQLSQRQVMDESHHWLAPEQVLTMPHLLNQNQQIFHQTGSVHGAAYIVNGDVIAVAEDIGRHNAVDKLFGYLARSEAWHPQGVLVLSSRVSFELMQKAVIAGVAVIVSVGAPSQVAVDIARQFDMTLIGFTKAEHFNLYNGHWRLMPEQE